MASRKYRQPNTLSYDKEYKLVHAKMFYPHKMPWSTTINGKTEVRAVECHNHTHCDLLDRGECAAAGLLRTSRCPYGAVISEEGFTPRAKKYNTWNKSKAEEYAEIPELNTYSIKMARVGFHIFLPYERMASNVDIFPFGGHDFFLAEKQFNLENILRIIRYVPRESYAKEAADYQEKVIPLFLKHLSESMPKVFNKIINIDAYAWRKSLEFSNLGRLALLDTVTPNKGTYEDIHGGIWHWDGEWLSSLNSKISFALINDFDEVKIKPTKHQIVKITDEAQVNDRTVFVS